MREIKFRAFVNGKMIYNVPLNKNGKYSHLISTGFAIQYDPEYKEFDVMQYTGLKDKNGKEIYEGDICKYEYGDFIVEFSSGSFIAVHDKEGHCEIMGKLFLEYVEIIGNIYENPELLK